MDYFFVILWLIIAFCVLAVAASNFIVVPQATVFVIERLGTYQGTWSVGMHFKIPIIEKIAKRVTLKEQIIDYPPQPVITKDNVTIHIDTVIYFQVTDPKLYTYGIVQPMFATEHLTSTTLRNIIGDLELDETLTSRDIINTKMRTILDEATDAWGIKVTRVEIKNIVPPREIQDAMEKQMKAERERRQVILKAEGEKQAQILKAEGEKNAEVLRAEANRISRIKEAEGEAEAMMKVQQALADSISMLNKSAPTEQVLKIKALEAFGQAANGQATKIIIPSDIQGMAGMATSMAEVFKSPIINQPTLADGAKMNFSEQDNV